jgi:hypothetical protein
VSRKNKEDEGLTLTLKGVAFSLYYDEGRLKHFVCVVISKDGS